MYFDLRLGWILFEVRKLVSRPAPSQSCPFNTDNKVKICKPLFGCVNSGLFQSRQGTCCLKEGLQRQRKCCEISLPLTRRNIQMNLSTTRVLMGKYKKWATSGICFEPRKCCTGLLCLGMPGELKERKVSLQLDLYLSTGAWLASKSNAK